MPRRKGAEEARAHLPELLDAAQKGIVTIITRRGKDVAEIGPPRSMAPKETSLLTLAGTMRGYWGEDPVRTLREMHDEWDR